MAKATRLHPDPAGKIAAMIPIGRDAAAVRQRIVAMERLLEGLFTIPGTNRKVGLDVILDVIPVGGDVVAAAMGAWMVWEARNLGMSKTQITRMSAMSGWISCSGWCRSSVPCPTSSSDRTRATCGSSRSISIGTIRRPR
jgi:hypothetical protein